MNTNHKSICVRPGSIGRWPVGDGCQPSRTSLQCFQQQTSSREQNPVSRIHNADFSAITCLTNGKESAAFAPMKVRAMIKLIEEDGWYLDRTRGSHRQYRHDQKKRCGHYCGKAQRRSCGGDAK